MSVEPADLHGLVEMILASEGPRTDTAAVLHEGAWCALLDAVVQLIQEVDASLDAGEVLRAKRDLSRLVRAATEALERLQED